MFIKEKTPQLFEMNDKVSESSSHMDKKYLYIIGRQESIDDLVEKTKDIFYNIFKNIYLEALSTTKKNTHFVLRCFQEKIEDLAKSTTEEFKAKLDNLNDDTKSIGETLFEIHVYNQSLYPTEVEVLKEDDESNESNESNVKMNLVLMFMRDTFKIIGREFWQTPYIFHAIMTESNPIVSIEFVERKIKEGIHLSIKRQTSKRAVSLYSHIFETSEEGKLCENENKVLQKGGSDVISGNENGKDEVKDEETKEKYENQKEDNAEVMKEIMNDGKDKIEIMNGEDKSTSSKASKASKSSKASTSSSSSTSLSKASKASKAFTDSESESVRSIESPNQNNKGDHKVVRPKSIRTEDSYDDIPSSSSSSSYSSPSTTSSSSSSSSSSSPSSSSSSSSPSSRALIRKMKEKKKDKKDKKDKKNKKMEVKKKKKSGKISSKSKRMKELSKYKNLFKI